MPSQRQARPGLHHLRFVLESAAGQLHFIPDVTSEDIAALWHEIADRRADRTVSIDVTFASDLKTGSGNGPASMGWLPTHLNWGRDPAD